MSVTDAKGQCRLCLRHKSLIKAHIIPRGFFTRIQTDEPNLLIDEHNFPKKSRKGVYDDHILCADCDNEIGKWDRYAQQILTMDMAGFTQVGPVESVGGWERSQYNYRLLKLFFISLVWRASISTHAFYKKIHRGTKFAEQARRMLLAEDAGVADDFGVVIARFTEPLGHAFLDPVTERVAGLNHVKFYVAGFIFYIKVDQRPFWADLAPFLLTDRQPLRVIKRSIYKGGEAKAFRKVMNAPKNRRIE